MKKPEIESKGPGEIKENKGISREEKFFRFIFASSILLATTSPSNYVPNEAQASGIDEKAPQGEVYLPSEEELGGLDGSLAEEESNQNFIFYPDFLTSPEEFCFLPSGIGSGLDSEGFIVEGEIEIVEEVLEEDVFAELEESLSPEVKEILNMQPELFFDEDGGLYYEDEEDTNSVLTIETDRHLIYPYEQLNDVKFFVIHYDGAPQTFASGGYRTVLNTMNGLNREGNPSVQFCVDSYPVSNEFVDNNGVGIIQSQATGPMPYKGRHVMIGYDLETGREDLNRVKTADLYEQVGVGQNFVDFIRAGYKDFDSFSLGLEQVGTNYSYNFPEQFPRNQQIANVLALVEAASERYGLSAWDIVGHHEIQEKSDPGDEYMLTLRFLLGLSYLLDEQLPDDFLETDDPYDYFVSLRDYSVARMGESRYSDWDEIYGLDGVIEWFENVGK
ncbi:MAG: N-acetylmuramoyl-L-alanine amidase [Candidatus Dojkabacteria bacterium]